MGKERRKINYEIHHEFGSDKCTMYYYQNNNVEYVEFFDKKGNSILVTSFDEFEIMMNLYNDDSICEEVTIEDINNIYSNH